MKFISICFALCKKLIQWYRSPIPGYRLIRVDPFFSVVTLLALVGVATTFWGMGRGMGVESVSVELAGALRGAPAALENNINAAFDAGQISGYEREVALQQVAELSEIYYEMADTIEDRGKDESFEAAAQAAMDTLMSYNPGAAAGSFVGASSVGGGLDSIYSILSLTNNIENFELFSTPFAEEESILQDRIQAVLGMDADALFMARVRTQINLIRRWYLEALDRNPCSGEQVLAEYRAGLIETEWGKNFPVYGTGEKWPTYEAFLDWLILEARGEGGELLTMRWEGDFTLGSVPAKSCNTICAPPAMSGTFWLLLNPETCEVYGEIQGSGEGSASTTRCEDSSKVLTSLATSSFSGTIEGSIDRTGNLIVNPIELTVITSQTLTDLDSGETASLNNEMIRELSLTGKLQSEGSSIGTLEILGSPCVVTGEWNLTRQ